MNALLEEVLARYGGQTYWNSLDQITARLSFGGLAFATRFNRTGLRERQVMISTRTPYAVFEDYPVPGQRGYFTPERVWLASVSGNTLDERWHPRTAFQSPRHGVWWDALDLLYFSGYALWNYLSTPFLLAFPGVYTAELGPWEEYGETWQRIGVRFPEAFPTHCTFQVFYFDEALRLRRHDYIPEVFASWARAAHYSTDEQRFGGLWVPTRRYVRPRTPHGTVYSWPSLVWIRLRDVVPGIASGAPCQEANAMRPWSVSASPRVTAR